MFEQLRAAWLRRKLEARLKLERVKAEVRIELEKQAHNAQLEKIRKNFEQRLRDL